MAATSWMPRLAALAASIGVKAVSGWKVEPSGAMIVMVTAVI